MAFIPDQAIDRMTELSAGAWRLYCFLARCRNQKTGKCFPSVVVTMETIGTKRRQTFQLRKELVAAGWAKFNGNSVTNLFGFDSAEIRTTNVDTREVTENSAEIRTESTKSAENRTASAENRTHECEKSHSHIGRTSKTNQQREPAKRESVTAVDEIATALCDLYRIPDSAGWRLRDKFQYLAIELLGVGATVVDVQTFYAARQKKPGVEFFVGDFVAWRASQNSNGLPPKKQNAGAYVGKYKPTKENSVEYDMDMSEFVDVAIRANDLVYLAKLRDEIIKRGGPKAEWENRVIAFFEQPIAGNEPVTPAEMADLNSRIAVAKEKTSLNLRAGR